LVINPFKNYSAVTDQIFLAYLQSIENNHDDGSTEMEAQLLMLRASIFYKNAITRKE
jgi:hypothetical protein